MARCVNEQCQRGVYARGMLRRTRSYAHIKLNYRWDAGAMQFFDPVRLSIVMSGRGLDVESDGLYRSGFGRAVFRGPK